MHVRSPEPGALPLTMTHGWPGSIVEFHKVIGPLTNPREHGGDPADAFHLVCPSLPGYGFSDKPSAPGWGVEKIGGAWTRLMAALGYQRYAAQGGDWGSSISTQVGLQDRDHCAAIHLNMAAAGPDPNTTDDLTEREQSALEAMKYYQDWESGYAKQQRTRPQTLGYALADSATGQAAWIIEKFQAWMDCDGHPENVLSKDELLDNVMLYWLPGTAASSARLYWEGGPSFGRSEVPVPTGISVFPQEIVRTSRRWAEKRYTNIIHFNELDKGGHFAAFEQPATFVDEVRTCFREVR